MDIQKTSRKRGTSKSRLDGVTDTPPVLSKQTTSTNLTAEQSAFTGKNETGETLSPSASGPGPFAVLLTFLIKNDRSEILRLAREIGVSDNTVYRWINGTSEPRPGHMRRLLEVLPHASPGFSAAPPGSAMSTNSHGRGMLQARSEYWEVPKEIYRRVMEQVAATADNVSRRWHIIETVFEYALLHLDAERRGMALTYARLMPPCKDGMIHSLYEAEMRGQAPWPFTLDFKAYLGSTTLAGAAVMQQRVQSWNRKDDEERHPIGLDDNEHSSCAAPVMRGGRLAGVLIVSSARHDFVRNPAIPRAVAEYAHLLATGMLDSDFYPGELIELVPMPELKWQREQISNIYLNRVVEYARKQCLSFTEAEQKVLQTLEEEFENHVYTSNAATNQPQAVLSYEPIR
ncbi:MAG TPA: helix-turn-helix domain-containing protein [Ktedonobacteraceae bacterium]